MSEAKSQSPSDLTVAYDGECPFCSAYVKMVRLRESVGRVELVNARQAHPFVEEIRATGLDINTGMVAKYGGQFYHGDGVIHLLAMLAGPSGMLNRVTACVFRHPTLAKTLYPWMVRGRNCVLRMRGHSMIPD